MFKLFLLFTTVPLVELWLLFQVSLHTGILPTVALVLLTGMVGAWLARWQGTATLRSMMSELAQGRVPKDQLLDGAMILVAGAVLLTPGIITDAIGFLLLIPPCRAVAKRVALAYFKKRWRVAKSGSGFVVEIQGGPVSSEDANHSRADQHTDGQVIDVTPEQTS